MSCVTAFPFSCNTMSNRCLTTVAVGVALFATMPAAAQFVERAPRIEIPDGSLASAEEIKPSNEILQQMAFDYSPEGTRARLKLAKFWLEPMEGTFIPLYLFTNPSLLLPAGEDSADYTAQELLSQVGGLVNVAAAKPFLFKGSIPGQVGPQGEVRIGGKYVQFPSEESNSLSGTFVAQAGGSLAWYMRLWGGHYTRAQLRNRPDTVSQAGVITFNARATASYLGGGRYRDLFASSTGDVPPSFLGSLQVDGTIHIFDQLFLTAGYTFSSSSLVEGSGSAGFSLSRP